MLVQDRVPFAARYRISQLKLYAPLAESGWYSNSLAVCPWDQLYSPTLLQRRNRSGRSIHPLHLAGVGASSGHNIFHRVEDQDAPYILLLLPTTAT